MDARIKLTINADTIDKAKKFAKSQGLSLSRLTEILLRKAVSEGYKNIEHMPIANWVYEVSEGPAEYRQPRNRKDLKTEYFNNRIVH